MKRLPFFVSLSTPLSAWRRLWFVSAFSLWLVALCLPTHAQTQADRGPSANEPLLRPVKLVSVSGNVQNAEALIRGHGGSATLTMIEGGPTPTIVVDYGRDVGGLPVFEIETVTQGTPELQAIYSESSQYLLPAGDGAPGFPNAPGDPSRVDTFPPTGPGVIVNRLIQGGERFEEITLAAPGTVTLRGLGIRATVFLRPPTVGSGSFLCSDPALNEIWGLGAYTLLLDELPVQSVPPLCAVSQQGLDVKYSPSVLYQGRGRLDGLQRQFRDRSGRE